METQNTFLLIVVTFQFALTWLLIVIKTEYPLSKKVSEYDQEIPQSQTADNLTTPQGRATQPSRDTRKTNPAKQPVLSSQSRWLQY